MISAALPQYAAMIQKFKTFKTERT